MQGFRAKTMSGMKWTYMSTILSRGISPITLIFLARLLTPADFGLVAMALAVTTLLKCFSDLGFNHAMVQQSGEDEKIASLAFWTLLLLGICWFVLMWITAPFVASYYKNDDVIPLLRVLGLSFIIQPFSDVPLAILLRDLKFKALFYRQLIPQLFQGASSVILAFLGYGAWALIIGNLVGIVGTSVVVWCVTSWRPTLSMDVRSYKSMFRFGSFVSIQNVLGWLMAKAGDLFVGRYLGASSLGFYRMGSTYGNLPLIFVGKPFHSVAYPMLCRLSNDLDEIKHKYKLYIKWISVVAIPSGIAIVFIMPFVIPILLGSRWIPAIPVLQFIALTSMLSSIVGLNTEVYKAIGRPDISVKFFSIRVMATLPVYYFASQQSITALALSQAGLTFFFVPINIFICTRVLGIGYFAVLKKLKTGLFLGLLLSIGGLSYRPLIADHLISNPFGNIFCLSFFLLILGGISLFVIDRSIFSHLADFIKNSCSFKAKEVVQ
jgi:teichuronic acid exporter